MATWPSSEAKPPTKEVPFNEIHLYLDKPGTFCRKLSGITGLEFKITVCNNGELHINQRTDESVKWLAEIYKRAELLTPCLTTLTVCTTNGNYKIYSDLSYESHSGVCSMAACSTLGEFLLKLFRGGVSTSIAQQLQNEVNKSAPESVSLGGGYLVTKTHLMGLELGSVHLSKLHQLPSCITEKIARGLEKGLLRKTKKVEYLLFNEGETYHRVSTRLGTKLANATDLANYRVFTGASVGKFTEQMAEGKYLDSDDAFLREFNEEVFRIQPRFKEQKMKENDAVIINTLQMDSGLWQYVQVNSGVTPYPLTYKTLKTNAVVKGDFVIVDCGGRNITCEVLDVADTIKEPKCVKIPIKTVLAKVFPTTDNEAVNSEQVLHYRKVKEEADANAERKRILENVSPETLAELQKVFSQATISSTVPALEQKEGTNV